MIHCYPGNPDYIGKDRDEEFKESIRRGNYEDHKGRLDKESYESMKEVVASDSVFHFYIETIGEIALNTIYDEAQFSIGNLSLDGLKYALQILESYNYNEFFEELDLLSSKFESCNTGKVDEYRFKAVFKKQFKYNLGRNGKISSMFVNSFRQELKKRIKYLEALKDDINKMIAIKMEGVVGIISPVPIAEADLQFMPNSLHAKTGSKLYNDVKPINDNTMEINYERIFAIALNYADDPEEMKEFCIRQQKEAAKINYKEKSFYKGLLKIVAKEREETSYGIVNHNTIVDESFIYVPSGTKYTYTYEEIDMIEQIINDLLFDSKTLEVEEVNHQKNEENKTIENFNVLERVLRKIEEEDTNINECKILNDSHSVDISTAPPSFDIPLTEDDLAKHYNELVKNANPILQYDTDYHHFCYAISGHTIPIDKQPYKVIKVSDYNKRFYNYLNDNIVKTKQIKQQKNLPNIYRRKAKSLFIDKSGKSLNLSNPN